jgi:hypothetical protein
MAPNKPDLSLLSDVVAQKVLDAMYAASKRLAELGVRHALAGGLAVGAHGHPRATKDVDFLVGEEAFERHLGGIVTMKAGVPIEVAGVVVDFLSANPNEAHLSRALPAVPPAQLPVVPIEALVYLKLKAGRLQDLADIVGLIKAGIDLDPVAAYLTQHAPELAAKWRSVVATARAEQAAD